MINNTSVQQWARLMAKNLDAQFENEMVVGLNCSPFEAEAIVGKVHDVYAPMFDSSQGLKPGQIQVVVTDESVAPNTPLAKAKQRVVTLTLDEGKEDIEFRRKHSIAALRRRRLVRMAREAFQQGGLLTLEDFARLFNCGLRTLVKDLKAVRHEGGMPPLRSTVRDMGRAVTHRREIVVHWLKGLEYTEIAYKCSHSVESVGNYVEKFKRCAGLFENGFDLDTVALLVRISPALAEQFHKIYLEEPAVAHRKKELQEFGKKNRVLALRRGARK